LTCLFYSLVQKLREANHPNFLQIKRGVRFHLGTLKTLKMANLHALLTQHSDKFNKLVELIPVKLYLTSNSTLLDDAVNQGIIYNKFAKNVAKPSNDAKKSIKRKKLDPEHATTSVVDLQQQHQEEESDEEKPVKKLKLNSGIPMSTTSVNDLKQKLQSKITLLQQKRISAQLPRSKQDILKGRLQKKKEKREKILRNKQNRTSAATPSTPSTPTTDSVAFNKLTKSSPSTKSTSAKASKPEKKIATKDLLAKVTSHSTKLSQLAQADPEKHKQIKESIEWNNALKKSEGKPVIDDANLLKKRMKREQHEKQKSKVAW